MARTGRPRIGQDTLRMKVPMRRDQRDALSIIASVEGLSIAEVIRRAIDREIKRMSRGAA